MAASGTTLLAVDRSPGKGSFLLRWLRFEAESRFDRKKWKSLCDVRKKSQVLLLGFLWIYEILGVQRCVLYNVFFIIIG